MHAFANPAKFLSLARPLTPWLFWLGLALILAGAYCGLFLTPADYLQGDSVRILYIHVPAAWLGMGGWSGMAIAALMQMVWRHPLAGVAGRAIAVPGALFTAICLATGSIWGRPTWGTWWEWDGRMTSMLVLLFLYFGYIALARASAEQAGGIGDDEGAFRPGQQPLGIVEAGPRAFEVTHPLEGDGGVGAEHGHGADHVVGEEREPLQEPGWLMVEGVGL